MPGELYEISGCPTVKLAVLPRPRAGDWLEDEVVGWARHGVQCVVSLLEREAERCRRHGLTFVWCPVPDRSVPPDVEAAAALVHRLAGELRAGRGVGIHCRMGLGRSTCLAVCVLATVGMPLADAWAAVAQARGLAVPDTPEQRAWVARFAASGGGGGWP